MVLTNSDAAWMAQIEQGPEEVRRLMLSVLAQVPTSEARLSGPRDSADTTFAKWQQVKVRDKVAVDHEEPLPLTHFDAVSEHPREFWRLNACTIETKEQKKLLLEDPEKLCSKNRYADIIPFRHSRVHLLPRASVAAKDAYVDGYINANFVDGPIGEPGNRKIIASQGPDYLTFMDHWRMIAQENVTLIVTTCKEVEQLRPKCFHYWPFEPELECQTRSGESKYATWQEGMQSHNMEVTRAAPDVQLADGLILRKLLLTDRDLGVSGRQICQLHFLAWPDHGVPESESLAAFTQMLEILTYMLLSSDQTEKALVHCSAGIGRTGTTVALTHLLVQLYAQRNTPEMAAEPKLSVFSTIRRLREQRFNMI